LTIFFGNFLSLGPKFCQNLAKKSSFFKVFEKKSENLEKYVSMVIFKFLKGLL